MPEQSVHHQEEADSDQQAYDKNKKLKAGVIYENDRRSCTGRIQCRN